MSAETRQAASGAGVSLRTGRLDRSSAGPSAVLTTKGLGCRGIAAAVHRVQATHRVAAIVLENITVAFLHSGSITASFERGSVVHTFNTGGIAILPAGSEAELTLSDADCTVVYLSPGNIPGVEADRYARLEIVPQIDPVDLQVTFLIACIREELQTGMRAGPRFMEGLGLALINHIFARYATAPTTQAIFRGGLSARQVRRAQETMMAALDESVPLAALAEEAGLSPWYFCRVYKQSTGLSPHRWMREKRLDRARDLLADDHRSLTSIAIDLGFASLSHFSATFKQATGLSPTRYRRNLAG